MTARRVSPLEGELCGVRVVHVDRVRRARAQEIPNKDLDYLAKVYKLLGDPTRLRTLIALKDGEMCVCDLASFLGVSESAVSHHLRRLRDLLLVKNRRDGQVLYYSLDDVHVENLLDACLDHIHE